MSMTSDNLVEKTLELTRTLGAQEAKVSLSRASHVGFGPERGAAGEEQ